MRLVMINAVLLMLGSATHALDCGLSQCASTQEDFLIMLFPKKPCNKREKNCKDPAALDYLCDGRHFFGRVVCLCFSTATHPVKVPLGYQVSNSGNGVQRWSDNCSL